MLNLGRQTSRIKLSEESVIFAWIPEKIVISIIEITLLPYFQAPGKKREGFCEVGQRENLTRTEKIFLFFKHDN